MRLAHCTRERYRGGAAGWPQCNGHMSQLPPKVYVAYVHFFQSAADAAWPSLLSLPPRLCCSRSVCCRCSPLFFAGTFCLAFPSSGAGRPVALPIILSPPFPSRVGRKLIDGTLEPTGRAALKHWSISVFDISSHTRPLARIPSGSQPTATAGHCAFRWNQAIIKSIAFRADLAAAAAAL